MPNSTFVAGSIDMQVRFESMGGNARRAQVYRRHEDLQRAFDHKVRALTRETRYTTEKLNRIQSEHLSRMKAIARLEPQTFREEWPPVDERRAILKELQEKEMRQALALAKQGKTQGVSYKKNIRQKNKALLNDGVSHNTKLNANSILVNNSSKPTDKQTTAGFKHNIIIREGPLVQDSLLKSKPSAVPKLTGVLGKPHWSHPTSKSRVDNSSSKENIPKINDESSPAEQNKVSVEPPTIADKDKSTELDAAANSTEQRLPMIRFSAPNGDKHKEATLNENPAHTRQKDRLSAPAAAVVAFSPSSQSTDKHRRQGSTDLDLVPRSSRARHQWNRHEDVLLFSVETRDGKMEYTHVTKRRYPSIV